MQPIDDRKLEALIKASDSGEQWAQEEYGRIFDENADDPNFIDRVCIARVNIYKDAAQKGDKNAILRLAHALAHLGYEKDAYNWYMSLINKGDTDAMLALSNQYNEYGCFGHNPDEEMKWLKLAANKGNAEAQCNMGRECLCESDWNNALLWYELAAKQNYPDGKIGYAKCLSNQLDAFYEYANGFKEVAPGRYDYIKKKYSNPSEQQCRFIMRDLYWKIEELFLDGLRGSNSKTYLSDAFSGLSFLYLYPKGVCEPAPYLAAFYRFEEDRVLDNKFAYDACLDIIKKNNLKVTAEDLKLWDKTDLFDWAKMRGLDILPREIPIVQNPQQPHQQKAQQSPQKIQTQASYNAKEQIPVSAQQGTTAGFVEFIVKDSLNPLCWANGTKYRFVVDGKREAVVVADKGDVLVRKPIPAGNHTVYLEVYADDEYTIKKGALSVVKQQVFTVQNGKTVVITATRGSLISATKMTITNK